MKRQFNFLKLAILVILVSVRFYIAIKNGDGIIDIITMFLLDLLSISIVITIHFQFARFVNAKIETPVDNERSRPSKRNHMDEILKSMKG